MQPYIAEEHQEIVSNQRRYLQAFLTRARVPNKVLEAADKLVPPQIVQTIPKEYSSAVREGKYPRQGFGLSGKVGCGKTMTMGIIARKLAWLFIKKESAINGKAALHLPFLRWVNWPEMAEELKSTSITNFSRVEIMVKELAEIPVLVLDDLGVERIKENYREDFATQRLDRIIDTRYSENRITFYTTNLDQPELVKNYGTRLVSRLLGMNPLIVLPSLPDLRMEPTHAREA